MNQINLIGNLTKEVEIKYSGSGSAYLKNTLAVKRKFKKNETDFIPITLFGKSAELVEQYCQKGSKLGITGRLQIDSKQENGEWKTYTTVIVDEFDFLDSKNKSDEKPSAYQDNSFDPFAESGKEIDISSDDLPF